MVAVLCPAKWSDVGIWDAVWAESKPDSSGNVISIATHAIESSNNLLRSETKNQHLVGVGCNNMMAIAMPDAIIIANKNRLQDVKMVVELLKKNNVS